MAEQWSATRIEFHSQVPEAADRSCKCKGEAARDETVFYLNRLELFPLHIPFRCRGPHLRSGANSETYLDVFLTAALERNTF
jgi:hypothetical protein